MLYCCCKVLSFIRTPQIPLNLIFASGILLQLKRHPVMNNVYNFGTLIVSLWVLAYFNDHF
jgi:hypothetical protein